MSSFNSNLYQVGDYSHSDDILEKALSICLPPFTVEDNHQNQNLSPKSKATAATNKHKEAERRRRKRINGHIATLKAILPNALKTDKASLLGEAVRRVKELKQATAELLTAVDNDDDEINPRNDSTAPKLPMFPTETDEIRVSPCGSEYLGLVKATLCCEDRPEMIVDLIEALNSVKAKVVRAEMSTIGGRTKSILWVELASSNVGSARDLGLGKLRQALKLVVEKSTLLAGSGQILPGNKRSRFHHS